MTDPHSDPCERCSAAHDAVWRWCDAGHRHWLCPECLGVLTRLAAKPDAMFQPPRCPAELTDAEAAMLQLRETDDAFRDRKADALDLTPTVRQRAAPAGGGPLDYWFADPEPKA